MILIIRERRFILKKLHMDPINSEHKNENACITSKNDQFDKTTQSFITKFI